MTSLYQHGFNLLPKPNRSPLSFGDEATRSQLPDFKTVSELSEFVERLFFYRLPIPGIYIQIKFCASYVCLLLLIIIMILSGRMYEKTFWILRPMKKPSGTVLVPNSMLAFSMIEGIYGILFVALLWEVDKFYEERSTLPFNFMAWLQLPWIPLIIGASMAALGTYFAIPSNTQQSFGVDSEESQVKNALRRFFTHSWFINSTTLLGPLAVIISVVIPTVWSSILFNRSLNQQLIWQEKYANLPDFTQEMVTDAQRVWYELLPSMRLAGVTMIVWTIWAFSIFVVYTSIAVRLVLAVRRELYKVENAKGPYRGFAVSTYHEPNEEEAGGAADIEKQNRLKFAAALHAGDDDDENGAKKENARLPKTSPVIPQTGGSEIESADAINSQTTKERKTSDATMIQERSISRSNSKLPLMPKGDGDVRQSQPNTERSSEEDLHNVLDRAIPMQFDEEGAAAMISTARKGGKKASKTSDNDSDRAGNTHGIRSFLPNIMMQKRPAQEMQKQITAGGRSQQRDALRKAFLHVCIQAVAISPACLLFMGIALLLAIGSYGGSEHPRNGGTLYEVIVCYALLFASWVTVVFGSVTLFAIAFRTYESVLTIVTFPSMLGQNSSSGANRANRSGKLNESNSGVAQTGSSGQRSGNNQISFTSPSRPRTGESNDHSSCHKLSRPLTSNKRKPSVKSSHTANTGLGIGMETSFFETETRQVNDTVRSTGGEGSDRDLTYEMSSFSSNPLSKFNDMEIGPLESFGEMPKNMPRAAMAEQQGSMHSSPGYNRHQARAYRRNDEGIQQYPVTPSPRSPPYRSPTSQQRAQTREEFDESQSYSDPEEERRYFQGGAGRRRASLKNTPRKPVPRS
ncbi:uncharacterized protein FA14DRAFT_19103 [Meira miltonrushii]|uniref:Uncharacterized protein n=1 Tax=Meira miltonrushii TaxID=1280837 RepID=A0A316VKK2_9BASI|nr:uncharacterized protein FA14DRAFT_19103 [Meira miltonrushii]PWN37774.1 hypothetical protein FA14DRAFT_19103 [Meira miltonrushii]